MIYHTLLAKKLCDNIYLNITLNSILADRKMQTLLSNITTFIRCHTAFWPTVYHSIYNIRATIILVQKQ